MSVWLTLPSKRPPKEVGPVLKQWRERGYRLAIWRDLMDEPIDDDLTHFIPMMDTYPGYAQVVNRLCKEILLFDEEAEWIVAAGDDTLPDPNHSAEEIARECREHFRQRWADSHDSDDLEALAECLDNETFGVMQPTGDPWADSAGRIIERIAGSPWIGREFARRMYGGAGPYWHEYTHCFVDEELMCVAQKLGVFWQRPDLTHHHNNWARAHAGRPQDMPEFLREANSPEHWSKYSEIFKARKGAGFPGHEPIL